MKQSLHLTGVLWPLLCLLHAQAAMRHSLLLQSGNSVENIPFVVK